MTIEMAFSIEAAQAAVWEALWSDLSSGDATAYTIIEAHRPRILSLEISLGGIPARLTYTIEDRDDHCEITAVLEPRGFRYQLSRIISFNHIKRNFELLVFQGLVNLKLAAEGRPSAPDDRETLASDTPS